MKIPEGAYRRARIAYDKVWTEPDPSHSCDRLLVPAIMCLGESKYRYLRNVRVT